MRLTAIMFNPNQFIMVLICALLLWLVNGYVVIAPLINLLFNMFLLALLVLYIMQFLGVIRDWLPAPRLFK
ncbi:hypothetical protein DIZ81_03415 [Legionella taurinensis]|uniref:Uncharacterized protein n=1 Tax=Legionella taurinensis TaxID=70611 RepID=A0AB38N8K8_9GAMM|nr:hypothetical protein DB744_03415 [Legionella taurinensis]TID37997.1 hypothetical protein DIZ42_03415 [Legionella taurinensis]TID38336.1 hypothetical protein DIZ67_03400 [Legionella taurinensis]TID45835.1 hypothetical protein DIZ81_03415 [Legionella taurinensis]TID55474.1 hypothetical protein DIZ47_03415 [Legionella taurinensis]